MKTYHLSDLLSVYTGRLVSLRGVDAVYDLGSYLTGETLFTHQLGRACEQARPCLEAQFPWLLKVASLVPALDALLEDEAKTPEAAVTEWVASVAFTLDVPQSLDVRPMALDDRSPRDPHEELVAMVGADRVAVVEVPDA